MTQALLGIDIGTSGCKALLIDADGAPLASCTQTYGLSQPHPGWTEQDPQLWVNGARASVAGVLARSPGVEIAVPCMTMRPSLGVSSNAMQRSSVVLPDPLGPTTQTTSRSITGSDTRVSTWLVPNVLLTPSATMIGVPAMFRA